MSVKEAGRSAEGAVVEASIRSAAGAMADILSWGAVVSDLSVPVGGGLRRVVLGFPTFAPYPEHSRNFGTIVGRHANRIRAGRFTLEGRQYQLSLNEARHHLHGGFRHFGKRIWNVVAHEERSVTLAIGAEDGEEGYPGNLEAECRYELAEPATLRVTLSARVDRPCPVSLAHHSYFNLDGSGDITGHVMEIAADKYTPVDADLIPTGEIRSVTGSGYDFTRPRSIGSSAFDAIAYDVNFVLAEKRRSAPQFAARVVSSKRDLAMEVWTTEPGLQFYDGHKLAVAVPGHDGQMYRARSGLCLEPQLFPNGPNEPGFPDSVLRPGDTYRQVTEYRFMAAG
ncbi:MAG: galactose mutarotase [Hyphomicrobiaceae bacterium]|nr:MAG: galactose mutarotase [Hyphomicrobiaceae bacterium]